MSEFDVLSKAMKAHINNIVESSQDLFLVDASPDELWTLYLKSFPPGTDPIFRTKTDHDCSSCRHFMRSFGNVVIIKNNVVTSIWDFADTLPSGSKYIPVVRALSNYIRNRKIIGPFVTDTPNIGVEKDHEKSESGTIITWEHMHIRLPGRFVNGTRQTLDQTRGKIRDQRNVFKRSLDEISDDAIASVLELIGQNSLYRGEEWKSVLESFQKHKVAYNKLGEEAKELYAWEQSRSAGPVIGKIRNHSIGVLLVDISKGMDLDEAVRRYESIVAPTNYKRPKAIFTKKMLEDAEKTITELGYLDSLERRHAILDDITVNNILFADRNVAPQLKGGSVFSEMASEVVTNPKKFDRVEEVPIDKFVSEILPAAQSIQVLLENRHQSNMVSLIAPKNSNSATMFKWSNGFSWAYSGNITDSMKMRVKALGG
ncbi:MAG: hypothetical protein GX465_17020, partial [Acidobacteria bacterium]|nr:hypothetical protein [Acidobacteriota bacterium]